MFISVIKISYNRKDLKPIARKIIEQKSCTRNEAYGGLVEAFYSNINRSVNNDTDLEGRSS